MTFQNVNFYVKKIDVRANSSAVFSDASTYINFEGCMLDIDSTDITYGTRHAGWIGAVTSDVNFTGCVTTGLIESPADAAAFVGRNAGRLRFTNCINLASVAGQGLVGGFVISSDTIASALSEIRIFRRPLLTQ